MKRPSTDREKRARLLHATLEPALAEACLNVPAMAGTEFR
jgi:hypothetical protein